MKQLTAAAKATVGRKIEDCPALSGVRVSLKSNESQLIRGNCHHTCDHCGTQFYGRVGRRFCSRACNSASQRIPAVYCCVICGKEVTTNPSEASRRTTCKQAQCLRAVAAYTGILKARRLPNGQRIEQAAKASGVALSMAYRNLKDGFSVDCKRGTPKGSAVRQAKLTEEQVLCIKAELAVYKGKQLPVEFCVDAASRYRCTPSNIRSIHMGRSWGWLIIQKPDGAA